MSIKARHLLWLTLMVMVVSLVIAGPVLARGGGGGGKGGGGAGIIALIVGGIYYIIWTIVVMIRNYRASSALNYLRDFDPAWDEKKINERISQIYFEVQHAWGNGNMDPVAHYMSPILREKWQLQLCGNTNKNLRNICEQISLHSIEVVGVLDLPNDAQDRVYVLIKGEMLDYMIDTVSKEIVKRSGNDKGAEGEKESFWEVWTLKRGDNGWVLDETSEETGILGIMKLPVDCLDNTYAMKVRCENVQ
ncbi:MAG: Tim44 domain-containing protein [Candidatus Riflebacteria bacterium]|nr:Tim44 domain-containing protein [Candidatus Riflebacteria bacterium]